MTEYEIQYSKGYELKTEPNATDQIGLTSFFIRD